MCGIIGFVGSVEAAPLLLKGLKRLEYRGYDSWGIAAVDEKIRLRKEVGKIGSVKAVLELSGKTGLAHTRWATHGKVTRENAHPHTDCKNEVAVVHNGIIENYAELKQELKARGHAFRSETDTEVVPHLVEEFLKKGLPLEKALAETVRRLKGSFALLVMHAGEPQKLVGARNESPLVVGLSEKGVFVASDVLAFLDETKRVIYLNDGEFVIASLKGIECFDFYGSRVEKKVVEVDWSVEQAEKGGFPHFMLKEIMEQPHAIKQTLLQNYAELNEFAEEVKRAPKVMVVACGTARHSAIVGKHLFAKLAGKQIEVMIASEFAYFADNIARDTLLIAVSQSGETADVLDGVRRVKARGLRVYSIVNVVGSTLARLSDKTIYLNCGPEIGVAATKSFLSQLTVFYLLAFALAGKLGEGTRELREASKLVEETIRLNEARLKKLAEKVKGQQSVYFIGRGVNFPIALEGALKLKEISYIHAEGMPAGELKHGTLALVEEGTPVVLLNPTDYTHEDALSNGMETKARGAFLIGVSNRANEAFDEFVSLPQASEFFYPLLEAIPLQLLAYYVSVSKELDPDKPRNLAKSCTVK